MIKHETLLKMRKSFREIFNNRSDKFSCLIMGESGSGKTYSLGTLPKPLLLHSFDRGGSRVLKDGVADGSIIVDTRFEDETPENPFVWGLWKQEFDTLVQKKIFKELGSYAITLFYDCMKENFIKREIV